MHITYIFTFVHLQTHGYTHTHTYTHTLSLSITQDLRWSCLPYWSRLGATVGERKYGMRSSRVADHEGDDAKTVLEKSQNFEKETFHSSTEFVRFLYDWILSHIAHTDRLYVDDLKAYLGEK